MSTFIVDCFDSVTSEITSKHRMLESVLIRGVRYEFYKAGLPSGTLTLEIYVDSILNTTQVLTFEDINAEIPRDYSHGYLTFELDTPVFVFVDKSIGFHEVEFKLYPTGYTFSEAANFGVIKRHNNKIVEDYGIDYAGAMSEEQAASHAPYSIEIYEII